MRWPGPVLWVLFAVLLVVFAVRLTHTAFEKSLTADEPHYIGTGLYLWATGDYHFASALNLHPPLAYHLASVPLLFFDLEGLVIDRTVSRRLRTRGTPSAETIRVVSRLPFIALSLWGALLCFLWAREVSGDAAGLLAAFLYTFSPMMLGNSALAHSDITATVFFLQTLYAFWRWVVRPSPLRLALCGVSLGFGLIAKSTGVLLMASLVLLFGVLALRPWRATRTLPWVGPEAFGRRLGWLFGRGIVLLALSLGVFWMGYGGSFGMIAVEEGPIRDVVLPGYVQSLIVDSVINAGGRVAFLLGEFSERGWWYYFPVAFAFKEPVAIVGLLVAALGSLAVRRGNLGWVIGVPAALYLGMALFWLDIPLGLRYVLPLFPLSFVFIATQLLPIEGRPMRVLLGCACAWLGVASVQIHPHYLAYFNELSGGPARGSEYLLDANIDWGQDLSTLARYLTERGNPPVALAYFGPEPTENYGFAAYRSVGCVRLPGLVAISVNVMEGLYSARNPFARPKPGCYDWLREFEPVAQPGYSIRVYEIPEH
ncbi:MAG: glycosyltransferase family 39 protein [Myxococcota bacterium]